MWIWKSTSGKCWISWILAPERTGIAPDGLQTMPADAWRHLGWVLMPGDDRGRVGSSKTSQNIQKSFEIPWKTIKNQWKSTKNNENHWFSWIFMIFCVFGQLRAGTEIFWDTFGEIPSTWSGFILSILRRKPATRSGSSISGRIKLHPASGLRPRIPLHPNQLPLKSLDFHVFSWFFAFSANFERS